MEIASWIFVQELLTIIARMNIYELRPSRGRRERCGQIRNDFDANISNSISDSFEKIPLLVARRCAFRSSPFLQSPPSLLQAIDNNGDPQEITSKTAASARTGCHILAEYASAAREASVPSLGL